MIITYGGIESFKVQFGDTTLAFNPISKDSKQKPMRFGSDIALVSLNNVDMNGVGEVSRGDKEPFIIKGPGEYEVKGVFIKGLPSISHYGSKNNEDIINTIYTVSLEGMNICFLGAIDTSDLKSETIEALDEIDILFLPVGGDGVLDPARANKLAVSLEPKIIIPMHYGSVGKDGALKAFLKETGENPEPTSKLTLKKKDLEGKNGDVIIITEGGE